MDIKHRAVTAAGPARWCRAQRAGGVAPGEPDGDPARDEGVVDDEGGVRAQGRPVGDGGDPGQEPRRQRRAADAGRVGLAGGLLRDAPGDLVGQGGVGGDRHAEDDRAPQPEGQVSPGELGRRVDIRDAPRRRDPRRAGREARHVVLADGHEGHATRLEHLERRRHVEDRLGPGADDDHRRPGELLEIGRDVEAGRLRGPGPAERAAVDAADATRREDRDPGRVRRDHRRRHGRRRPAGARSGPPRDSGGPPS